MKPPGVGCYSRKYQSLLTGMLPNSTPDVVAYIEAPDVGAYNDHFGIAKWGRVA
jgi:hypothetical protein